MNKDDKNITRVSNLGTQIGEHRVLVVGQPGSVDDSLLPSGLQAVRECSLTAHVVELLNLGTIQRAVADADVVDGAVEG